MTIKFQFFKIQIPKKMTEFEYLKIDIWSLFGICGLNTVISKL